MRRSNAIRATPFPTSLREPKSWHSNVTLSALPREGTPIPRRNAKQCSPFPNFNQRSNIIRRNAKDHTPLKGRGTRASQKCLVSNAHPSQLILTRGQHNNAEMPFDERLATKEIQYGHKI